MKNQALFILAIIISFSCIEQEEQKRPNILYIMSDDHTSQAWGIYGGTLKDYVQAPNIKRLAEEGCTLQNVFCTNSICTPSRASIMTGRYSHQNGVYTLTEGLHPDSMNVAKAMKAGGYETAIVGKWHLKKKPSGFDFFNVLPGQGRYNNPILKNAQNWDAGGQEYEGFSSDVIGDESLKWLKSKKGDKPFFLMCHFKATHEPFYYPERKKSLYEGIEIPEPDNLLDFQGYQSGRTFDGQILEILGDRYVNDAGKKNKRYPGTDFDLDGLDSIGIRKKVYQKFVKDFMRSGSAIDDNIGKLLSYLDESGQAENTVVIYTADQGYFLGEHGFFDKRMFYEEALRMPFVIRYPGEISSGSTNEDIILNHDFPSLFLDYAGISNDYFNVGKSFRQNLAGNTSPDWRDKMYYRYWLHQTNRPAHFGLRDERYKLIFFYGQHLDMLGAHKENTAPSWEFYDLQKDPKENHNVYGDKQYATIIEQMKRELLVEKERVGDRDDDFAPMVEIINTQFNLKQ